MNSTGKLLFVVAFWVLMATVQRVLADTNVVSFAETNVYIGENAGAVTVRRCQQITFTNLHDHFFRNRSTHPRPLQGRDFQGGDD